MRERSVGILNILLSAVCFTLTTFITKYVTTAGNTHAAYVTMARFVVGLMISLPMIIRDPSILRANRPLWVGLRAIGNIAAVYLFFFGIQHTSVSKANLLNMTYPVFVFVMAPFITREKPKIITILLLLLTMTGVWNVVRPPEKFVFSEIAFGDILAFSSAILAGFSIAVLRRARSYDSGPTIVFYIMLIGALTNVVFLIGKPLPSPDFLLAIFGAGLLGTLGQYSLTAGFAHVTAPTGALLSTSRILMAIPLGIVLFGDVISKRTILGAVLIVVSLVGASLIERRRYVSSIRQ